MEHLLDGELAQLRLGLDAFAAAVSVTEPVECVEDGLVGGVPVRSYGTAAQVLVWAHGGGFVSGSLDAIDPVCRALSNRTGLRVVSVGYRLAPEHPFPAALEDVLTVVRGTPGVLAVGGDSAGGGLAAAAAREAPGLRALVLLCPWLDLTLTSPSVLEEGSGAGLTAEALRAFASLYTDQPADPRASPLLAPDLVGLPPVVVVTAEHDPLRDEGERYAARVVAAGGEAVVRRWAGTVHGFAGMTAELAEAAEAQDWVAQRLVEVLRRA
ncbi:MAG: hypothetical protein JWN77_3284 [Frankiales bacterium]|nr:hypothetical protein [Frankiales bacterium]